MHLIIEFFFYHLFDEMDQRFCINSSLIRTISKETTFKIVTADGMAFDS